MQLKFIPILLFFLLAFAQCAYDEHEYGLCIDVRTDCPPATQKYGVCCNLNGNPTYFANHCLACAGGCFEWKYLATKNGSC